MCVILYVIPEILCSVIDLIVIYKDKVIAVMKQKYTRRSTDTSKKTKKVESPVSLRQEEDDFCQDQVQCRAAES